MGILKNPTEITEAVRLAGLIYGPPGVGKTTLALSAATPVLIDADKSMRRVEKRFQVTSLPLDGYASLLELLASSELDPFETIIIDTLGRLVDRMGDYLAADNAAYRQKDGSLSLKGFGKLKLEFQRLLRLVQDHQKHLIFVAHDREERDGDNRIVRPDGGPGSAGKDLIKDLDFIGYMEMLGNERTISFSPCEKFYAKNALQLPPMIRVPDTKDGNTFIKDYLLGRAVERMIADEEENQRYVELVAELQSVVTAVSSAEDADKALAHLQQAPVIWDSLRIARRALADRTKEAGMIYDRASKKFAEVETPKKEETEHAEMAANS
jgi:hypothetical protein